MLDLLDHSLRKRTAVILNMGANGLGVARSLGPLGISVLGLDFDPMPAGFHSRYVKGLRCPSPIDHPGDLLELLKDQGMALPEKGVLYPCTDAFMQFVSRNRKELSKWYELMLPSEEVVEGIVNKRYQYEWAERLGIPMPQTFFPQDMDEVREIRNVVRYPAFIKGHTSHLWNIRFGNKGFIVRDPEELELRFAQVFEAGLEALVQKIMMPPGENLIAVGAYLGREGYATPPFTWQKVRQTPPNFGIGSLVVSKCAPEIGEMALRFMKSIGHMGPGVVGFKLDQDDGEWKLVEMNGRLWFQNHLATRCGINLPWLQYLDSQGIRPPAIDGFEEGVSWWDPMTDFSSFIRLRRAGRLGAVKWIRSWFVPDVFPYYAKGDARPSLEHAQYGLRWLKEMTYLMKMKVDEDALWHTRDML